MRQCDEVQVALSVFSGASHPDLPDDIVLHIESCPACMDGFEVFFPPVQFAPEPVVRSQPRQRGAVMVAAVALLAVGMSAPPPESDPMAFMPLAESALTHEEMLAADPECPVLIGDHDPPVCSEDGGEWM